jgi:ADP-ribosyl-[dinitrogen reductase] hydrolase
MPDETLSLADRLSGGLIGLLVGDALGVPYEFHPPQEIPAPALIEFAPPAGFYRAHPGIEPGTWSDDGAQALCLLASLLHKDRLDPQDLANRLVNWHDHGDLAVDGLVFDVGFQTMEAIRRLRVGASPLTAGGNAENSQGNGSLMRVLPLVLWHTGTDAELVRDAHDQSCPTHGHVTVLVCCALYCLWARRILQGVADPWGDAVTVLRRLYRDSPPFLNALDHDVRPDDDRIARGTGYVVDCLFSARAVLDAGGYEQVVKAAVALGHDTDTTACVAGGLAGLRDGVGAIPARWRQALRGQEALEPLLEGLLAARAI